MPSKSDAAFPHCDQRVLHAPGKCSVCDEYGADLQRIRAAWGINFTGEYAPGKYLCPAENARGLQNINRWYGNVPAPIIHDKEEVAATAAAIQQALADTTP